MDLELFKDLCSRLPYGTIVNVDNGKYREDVKLKTHILNTTDDWDPKPYLRPMSSMTEEEWEEYNKSGGVDGVMVPLASEIDWLNSHHFDYRGLIEKNLALEAPAGMYE